MNNRRRLPFAHLAALAALVLTLGAPSPAGASGRMMSLHGTQVVNVNVSFNTEVPLPDLSEAAIAATQEEGRRFLYRLGRAECAVLKDVIAKTCRLTNLNVSARIRTQGDARPPRLYINGNATFAISLKDDKAAAKK